MDKQQILANNDKEDKSARFKRLASKRTTDVLNKLRILGNLSNRSAYEYTDAEVKQIFAAIDDQVRVVKSKFMKLKKGRFEL